MLLASLPQRVRDCLHEREFTNISINFEDTHWLASCTLAKTTTNAPCGTQSIWRIPRHAVSSPSVLCSSIELLLPSHRTSSSHSDQSVIFAVSHCPAWSHLCSHEKPHQGFWFYRQQWTSIWWSHLAYCSCELGSNSEIGLWGQSLQLWQLHTWTLQIHSGSRGRSTYRLDATELLDCSTSSITPERFVQKERSIPHIWLLCRCFQASVRIGICMKRRCSCKWVQRDFHWVPSIPMGRVLWVADNPLAVRWWFGGSCSYTIIFIAVYQGKTDGWRVYVVIEPFGVGE